MPESTPHEDGDGVIGAERRAAGLTYWDGAPGGHEAPRELLGARAGRSRITGALDGAVGGRPGDVEQLGEVEGGVPAGAPQGHELAFLAGRELRLLAAQAALGLGDGHAFAGARPGGVGLEL